MQINTDKFILTNTGERLATLQVTVSLCAEELALLLCGDQNALYGLEDAEPVKVTEAAIRKAVAAAVDEHAVRLSYQAGDDNATDVVDAVKAVVVAKVFGGKQFRSIPT